MARTQGSDGVKTEEAIRQAAIVLIAGEGFKAVTLRSIAAKVGIQAGSIYRYFPSKDDLLYAILKQHMLQLLEAWDQAVSAGATPEADLHAFVDFHIRYHMDKQDEIFISNMELRGLAAEHRAEIFALRRRYEAILETIIARGQQDGRFTAGSPRILSFAILAMLTGIFTWFKPDGPLSTAALSELYFGLVSGGILSMPRAE